MSCEQCLQNINIENPFRKLGPLVSSMTFRLQQKKDNLYNEASNDPFYQI